MEDMSYLIALQITWSRAILTVSGTHSWEIELLVSRVLWVLEMT